MRKGRRLIVSLALALALVLSFSVPAFAATSDTVDVTATPSFIGIDITPITWSVGGADAKILTSTTYWSNPLGATTAPTGTGALDTECEFTVTNTSTVVTSLTCTFPNMTSGDASTNSDTDTPGANAFGARTYFSGQATADWALANATAPVVGKTALAANTNIKFGFKYQTQTGAWTSGVAMTSTVSIAATAD